MFLMPVRCSAAVRYGHEGSPLRHRSIGAAGCVVGAAGGEDRPHVRRRGARGRASARCRRCTVRRIGRSGWTAGREHLALHWSRDPITHDAPNGTRSATVTWHIWWFFVVTELVLCLSPGPAVLFVVAQALGHGTRRSVWASLGILASNGFYFVLSALGLGAVLLASHVLFRAVKYAGAAYLVWLGIGTIRGGGMAMRVRP